MVIPTDTDTVFYEYEGVDKVMSFIQLRNGWYLIAAPPVKEVFASVNNMKPFSCYCAAHNYLACPPYGLLHWSKTGCTHQGGQ